MNERIKVLNIISDTNFGGAGRLLINLSKCIDKEKFDFEFAVPQNSKLIKILKKEGSVYCFSGVGDKSFDLRSIPSLCRIIKRTAPDIIHTHSSFSGRLASKITSRRAHVTVYTKHCVFPLPQWSKYKICRMIFSIIDNIFADKTVAVAEAARQELISKGVSANKISVIINGSLPLELYSDLKKAEIKNRLGISPNDFVVGIVARLEEYKGHKTLLDAAKLSKEDGENIKFIIIGDGSKREELSAYSRLLNISDRVIFTGFVSNVAEYVNILDLNINCSTGTETSCLAISEGASIGIPAIVSDFGGNPNMVINGSTGCVFAQNNAKQLYKIIKNLKNTPEILSLMKENIKSDYYKRFSALQMAKNYEQFYIELKGNL